MDKKEIKYTGKPLQTRRDDDILVVEWPRTIKHIHTYGKLSPFFQNLRKGLLSATFCPNKDCEENRLWIPPRADCPDCIQPMEWKVLDNPIVGTIYTFTKVEYPGEGIELETPYYQIDVNLGENFATIPKGYLLYGEPYTGMQVQAGFRTQNPTNTILDLFWTPTE